MVEIWVDSVSLQPFTQEQWRAHQDEAIEKVISIFFPQLIYYYFLKSQILFLKSQSNFKNRRFQNFVFVCKISLKI